MFLDLHKVLIANYFQWRLNYRKYSTDWQLVLFSLVIKTVWKFVLCIRVNISVLKHVAYHLLAFEHALQGNYDSVKRVMLKQIACEKLAACQ